MVDQAMTRTDEEIQREVLEEMKWDPRLQRNEIGVRAKNGIVTLTGFVDSLIQKWAAEDAAHRVRGVLGVANDLEVRLPISDIRTDDEIAVSALWALTWDAEIPAENIEVTVSQGWLTLRGQVEWQYQRQDAENAVRRLAGVRGISNQITVRPHNEALPVQMTRDIGKALSRSADMDGRQINVDVQEGDVVLTGTVGSWAQKEEAERLAWLAPGAADVENQIQVRN